MDTSARDIFEVEHLREQNLKLIGELAAALAWMELCQKHEHGIHRSQGYAVRIAAARSLLYGAPFKVKT